MRLHWRVTCAHLLFCPVPFLSVSLSHESWPSPLSRTTQLYSAPTAVFILLLASILGSVRSVLNSSGRRIQNCSLGREVTNPSSSEVLKKICCVSTVPD
jgi:hypothetical protein